MRADDFQLGKIRRHFVEMDRLAIFQFDAHAAGGAGAGRRHAAVKQDRHIEFGALFPERIEADVVGEKMLARRIEFAHARQSQIFAAFDFVQGELAGPRIDGAEGQEHVGMFFYCAGDMIVGHGSQAGDGLVARVHDHRHHLARAVLVGHLVNGNRRPFAAKIFRHLCGAIAFSLLGGFIGK